MASISTPKSLSKEECMDEKDLYTIREFDKGVTDGSFSDEDGRAYLVINGRVQNSVTIHINRRVVSSSSQIISFVGLLHHYGEDNLRVKYVKKDIILMSIDEYIAMRNAADGKKKKSKSKDKGKKK